MAEVTSSIVEIDLSPFSVSHRFSIPSLLVVPIIFGWVFVVVLLLLVSVPLAIALGVATLAGIIINFIITARRRLTVSTTGRKTDFILAEQLDQRPPGFDRTFGEIIQTVDTFRPGAETDAATRRAAGMSKRTHAAIYIAFGVLIVLIGLPLIFALRLGGALLGPAVMLVVAAMYAMFTRARRVLQPSAAEARQGDPRPPILFLRSFLDDRYKLKERVRVAGVPINQLLRMEEALAVRFHDFGPFLAVGEPGEGLPQLGAARAYLSDDQWQAAVLNWIRESRLIAMLCGPTHWIHWEMQNIIRFNRLGQVLLLLPPGRKLGSALARRRQERWDNIVRSLEQTPYVSSLRHLQIDHILLVQFRPDGRLRVFRSASDLVQDYELALTLAIYTALTEPGAVETPAVGEPVAPPILSQRDAGGASRVVAPPRDNWLFVKVALSGLVGGVVASGVTATPGIHRWLITPIRSVLFAAAVTAGAAIFHNKGGRFLGWLFGCIAVAHFTASTAGFFLSASLPRDAMKIDFVRTGFVITWLLIPICVFGALALRFRSFRHGRVWFAALMAGLLIGVLAPLGYSPRDGQLVAALRFSLAPWTLLAACIGYGLSLREDSW